MVKQLRVVQIGTSHDHAADHVDTMRALSDLFELVGVCEPDEKKRKEALQHRSYDGLRLSYEGVRWLTIEEILSMDDLDAAVIESEELELVPYAQMMADKGLPVHMDKPCGDDYAAFEKLVNTMRTKNLPLHIGYMYRYNTAVQYCKDLKESGRLGDIFCVEAQMSVLHNVEKRRWLKRFKGGMMFFLGCHLVDIVCTMCGEPDEIIPYNTCTSIDGVDSEDYGFALFVYKNGISFVKACASEVNGFDRRQIVVTGSKGTVLIEPVEERTGGPNVEEFASAHVAFFEDGIANPFGKAGEDIYFGPFGRYIGMMQDFAAVVRGEQKNAFSYDYELKVQRMLLKACGNWKGNE
ncbi:MAG: Gfo/Idh/MocA family oxidoreductase [Christensenella sp.]